MPDRDNAELWERTIGCRRMARYAHSTKTARSAESHYSPGAGEGSSDLATPFNPSGEGSPGAPNGGGRGKGPTVVHRGARHQQGAWRPTDARVLRLRPTSRAVRGRSARSGRKDISRRRAERRPRSLGRLATTNNEDTMFTEINPTPNRAADCPEPHRITTAWVDVRQRLSTALKYRGVSEICIGVREFECSGVSPPQDACPVYQ
jgi:hypothetical protein